MIAEKNYDTVPRIQFPKVFDHHLFEKLKNSMHSNIGHEKLYRRNRFMIPLIKMKDLSSDWEEVFDYFRDPKIVKFLIKEVSFGNPDVEEELLRSIKSINGVIYHDKEGYFINNHTDISSKKITLCVYIDKIGSPHGTTFTNNKENVEIPFISNTGYAFRVTKKSFHHVKKVKKDEERFTLFIFYTDGKTKNQKGSSVDGFPLNY